MPRKYKSDTFDLWKKSGVLESKLALISDLTARRSSQLVISQQLGISPKTFSLLKNKHSEIRKAILEGEDRLKSALLDAVYKRAMGFETTDEVTTLEIVNERQKKRIVKTRKTFPPDVEACKYLLTIKFGKDYSPKKYELELMEKKIKCDKEVWDENLLGKEEDDI